MLVALTALFFFIALLLMIIILIQPGSSGGLGFIGGGSQSAFGTQTGNVMTKITTTLAALFLIVSFVLGYINAHQGRVDTKQIIELNKEAQQAPSGQAPSGEVPSGQIPSGEVPSGEIPSGEIPSGEIPSGETSEETQRGEIGVDISDTNE